MINCNQDLDEKILPGSLVDRVNKSLDGQLSRDDTLTLRADLVEKYGLGSDTDIPCPGCKKPLVVTYKSGVACLKDEGCGKTAPDYTFL